MAIPNGNANPNLAQNSASLERRVAFLEFEIGLLKYQGGTPGPAGPTGATGATGPAGPAGPGATAFLCDATAGPIAQALPAATTVGTIAIVKKTDAGANGVTAVPHLTDTIDGSNSATLPITIQNDVIRLIVTAAGAWATF